MTSLSSVSEKFIILPIKNVVIFPGFVVPIFLNKKKSMGIIKEAEQRDCSILFVTCDIHDENFSDQQLQGHIGTMGKVTNVTELEEGVRVFVKGIQTFEIQTIEERSPFITVSAIPFQKTIKSEEAVESFREAILKLVKANREAYKDLDIDERLELQELIYSMAFRLPFALSKKIEILKAPLLEEACEILEDVLVKILSKWKIEQKVSANILKKLQVQQDTYLRNVRFQALQDMHGDEDLKALIQDFESLNLPSEVDKKIEQEIRRLINTNPASAEYSVIKGYLEFVKELPWEHSINTKVDLATARTILEESHYGMEECKKICLHYIAQKIRSDEIHQENSKKQANVLCFVGPPGTGKTTIVEAMAKALGRTFTRIPLGGIDNLAELKGHRKTYVAAMPGRIAEAFKKTGCNNPVILLDEIDKMSLSHHGGNPVSALMEALDDQQNKIFEDHYLGFPYDISKAIFVCTANYLENIPIPLLDRLEIVQTTAYSCEEKIKIARNYLIPLQLSKTGLSASEIYISDNALEKMIQNYCVEAGVRRLDRAIHRIMLSVLTEILEKSPRVKNGKITVGASQLRHYLKAPPYPTEKIPKEDRVGVANGLAWSEVGGKMLSVEVVKIPYSRKGAIKCTGNVGKVMGESTEMSHRAVLSMAKKLSISKENTVCDLHIHFTKGAIPKDGPSAGLAISAAITSVLLDKPLNSQVAMTGEMSLTGHILPIGGVKDKMLAAYYAGVKTVLIPKENADDLNAVPKKVRDALNIKTISHFEEALPYLFTQE